MKAYRDFVKELVRDSSEATEYLTAALEDYEVDGNLPAFLKAIRTVVDAQGGITKLAEKTNLNRQHLYRSLSEDGNPTIKTLDAILHALGLRLTIIKAS
ncbi:MAG: addiction module antidote protein [Spirochaetia bacterium]|nr:addiction module antidote protein [Spirochaetia bacterium]